jgi:hypothetical protein
MSPEDPAVVDILSRAMVARIATLSRNGRPSINPLYFLHVDGRVHLGTSERTLAALNARACPNVALLFEVERDPADTRVMRILGRATVRTDPDVCRRYARGATRKYFGSFGGLGNALAHAHLLNLMHRYHTSGWKGPACVLDVVPERAEVLVAPG